MSSVTRRGADPAPDDRRAIGARPSRPHPGRPRLEHVCVHQLVSAQARRTPDSLALRSEGRTLTYAELDARSNLLAQRLRGLGVRPEVRVGLCLRRSCDLLVGLLGVLKAGGAYVPLDPSYPEERLAFMLEDCGASVLLTQSDLRETLPSRTRPIVCLDREEGGEGAPARGGGPVRTLAENLAYVIYTSGSTGRPKGVQITHANLVNALLSFRRLFGITGDDAMLAATTLSFDIAALELLLPLTVGARVDLVGREEAADGARLAGRIARDGITFLQATPATWRLLLEAGWAGHESLTMLCGGEAMPRELADRLLPRGKALWNLYGPTETTIWSSAARVAPGPEPVVIGRPIANTQLYVLDARLQPVPIGVAGELYIGGLGLSRGYLDRPGLTAERFIPDPLGGRPGSRLYRTGDMARWRPGGGLECLGRVDHQVKIRGHRIELGEVEAALERSPSVRRAVAAAREDSSGGSALVAYVVPEPGRPEPTASELRRALAESLPDYMVPSAFAFLPEMPLTPNGKLDRRALPAPEDLRNRSGGAYVEPRTATEQALAGIWSDVLGLGRVGIRENFFELGGHSLLATQVVSRVRQDFATELPVRVLFESPTVESLAARIDSLEPGNRGPRASPIRPLPREGRLPLSFAQEALWFLHQIAPDEPTFNVVTAARVVGPLDIETLGRSFREMVRRQESLRTTFAADDGRPHQVIHPEVSVAIDTVDLTVLPADRRQPEAERLAREEARKSFDLADGPLVRATIIRLGEQEHGVVLTMHHIITDGWSFGIAAGELAALYQSFASGEASPLDELPIQYADFAAWQRERLQGDVLANLADYWKARLSGLPALELPTDHPRPAVRSARGDLVPFSLPEGLSGRLLELSRGENATAFMTLLAAFQVLLGRYSGQGDFAVGTPIANRNRAEVEGLIGYFVNMLVLRADLSGDPSFREFLGRVRDEALGAYEHQELPLSVLLESLQPERDASRTPLFQVMFILQNNRMPDAEKPDLALEPLGGGGTGTAKFDLTLAMEETDDGLIGSFEYSTDLFEPATIERMVGHFRTLLEGIVADPDRPLSDLSLLDESERAGLLAWAGGIRDEPNGEHIISLFEIQAAKTPEVIAAECSGRTLTYRELNDRANRLAHHLRRHGIRPEARVGIGLRRSIDLAVALLGVLKAGGAYVPLDPSYPRERLSFMLEDARVEILLTQEEIRGAWPEHIAPILCLDSDPTLIGGERDESPPRVTHPDHPAYVIYTSGTTGQPRGVVITHRGLVNHNAATSKLFGLGPGDRVLQFSPLSFDIAVEEVFPSWISGATVVMRGESLLPPAEFSEWVEQQRITVLDLPTAFWHSWIEGLAELGRSLPISLRLVVVGGEEALPTVYETWRRIGGDRIRWLNTYGPTEATVIATAFSPPNPEGHSTGGLPIGRPIDNVRAYVLDPHLRMVPVGLPGELYLGGIGLARGYLGRAGLTASRFLPDPFRPGTGARMYRTGDRARWGDDGDLIFMGRVDEQIKVRGFRVEPSEVEAALLQHPGVREAVVRAADGGSAPQSLIAYFVAGTGEAAEPDDLRRFLKGRLPNYMVPSAFVRLPALPLTPSGKVDRQALPAPDAADFGRRGPIVEPRDGLEAGVRALWEEILETAPIGVTDDFFEVGGNSLRALRLSARLEKEYGRRVPLPALLLGATIEDLARRLRDEDAPTAASPLVDFGVTGPGRPFYCIHPVGGGVLCYRELARLSDGGRPVFGLQARGLDGEGEPEACLASLAERYVAAIRTRHPDGPYHLVGWSLGGVIAFEMALRLRGEGQEVGSLVLIDTPAPAPGGRLDGRTMAIDFLRDLIRVAGGDGPPSRDRLRAIDPGVPQSWIPVLAEIDPHLASELGSNRLRHLFEVFRANRLALGDYVPRAYAGPMTLVRARGGRSDGLADPTLGWGRFASGGISVRVLSGDHYSLLRRPVVEELSALIETAFSASESAR